MLPSGGCTGCCSERAENAPGSRLPALRGGSRGLQSAAVSDREGGLRGRLESHGRGSQVWEGQAGGQQRTARPVRCPPPASCHPHPAWQIFLCSNKPPWALPQGLCTAVLLLALPSRVSAQMPSGEAFPALPQGAAHSPVLDLIQLIRLVPAMTSEVIFCLLAFSLRTDALPVSSSGNPQHLQQCLTHSRCLVNTNPLASGRAGAAVWVLGLCTGRKRERDGEEQAFSGSRCPCLGGGGVEGTGAFPSMTLRAGPEPQGPPGPVSHDGCGPGQESRGTAPPPARTPTPAQTGKAFVLTYPPGTAVSTSGAPGTPVCPASAWVPSPHCAAAVGLREQCRAVCSVCDTRRSQARWKPGTHCNAFFLTPSTRYGRFPM